MVAQLCALAAWWESYPLLWSYLWLSPVSSLLTICFPQDLLKHTSLWLRRITEHQTHKPHYPSLSWMHEIDTYIAKQLELEIASLNARKQSISLSGLRDTFCKLAYFTNPERTMHANNDTTPKRHKERQTSPRMKEIDIQAIQGRMVHSMFP